MKLIKPTAAALVSLISVAAHGQQLEITLTNLTHGIHFTPFVVAGHGVDNHIFQTGQSATPELQALAEGGDISGIVANLNSVGASIIENPVGGLLAPGAATTFELETGDNQYLSLAAMLLPTNDGFAGVDAWQIPETAGVYWLDVNAYDAGTEANDEIINGGGAPGTPGIPAAPGMDGGVNASGVATVDTNPMVHIHRGNLGDDDLTGGTSDVDNRIHRWLNPVIRVRVEVR